MLKNKVELNDLAIKYQTDKSSLRHNYCVAYEEHFEKIRNKSLNILEIGILNGSSLKLWKEYFPNSNIFGIDINPDCKKYEENRIKIEIGDQTDCKFLEEIISKNKFDIIIDDGSHIWDHLVITFEFLFPHLNQNGIYVMEDLLDCYGEFHSGEAGINAINFLKNTVDNVNYHGMVFKPNSKIKAANFKYDIIKSKKTNYKNYIKSMHFYCGISFIKKY